MNENIDFGLCHQSLCDEIEFLRSMYNSNELILPDEVTSFSGNGDTQIIFRLDLSGVRPEIVVQYGSEYPIKAKPRVMVRCNDLNTVELNNHLREHIEKSPFGEPLTINFIQWIQDNISLFKLQNEPNINSLENSGNEEKTWARLWIYSHHLYSTLKRKNIETLAKSLKLHGFSIPGKPGVIVIEGIMEDCEQFWQTIRAWQWHRIVIRHREQFTGIENFIRLDQFKELHFPSADLKKYLTNAGLGYGFGLLFNL